MSMGGVGWSQTFINNCFKAYLTPFFPGEFMVKVPNLWNWGGGWMGGLVHKIGSIVPNLPFSWLSLHCYNEISFTRNPQHRNLQRWLFTSYKHDPSRPPWPMSATSSSSAIDNVLEKVSKTFIWNLSLQWGWAWGVPLICKSTPY